MEDAMNQELAIVYIPKFREYGIRVLDGGTSYKLIDYCPWCGVKLPTSLREQWFKEIYQLGFEPGSDNIPVEYQTDAWWNKSNHIW
jgi:hypothetical protein